MKYYIVFGSTRRPVGFMGETYLDWSNPPIGVYQAESPEEAFVAAARDSDSFGTFFAIEGTPHGVEMVDSGATKFGHKGSPADERMARLLDRMEERDRQIAELTEKTSGGGEPNG